MLTYFVQVNVCWLLFYGAYFALLSRETFFRLNRIWLIISLLGGLILPLVAPSFEVVEPTNMAAVMLQPFVVSASDLSQNLQNTEGVVFKILTAIYGLGVVFTLGKLLYGFWKIKRLLNRAERLPMDDFTLMQVSEAIAPFSFFRWVFINFNLIERADLEQIILHERAHVRERHSWDVVFVNLLNVVFWWSPLVYFYIKSIKNVHEYAADAAVLRTSSPPQYGRLLLRQQQSGMSLSLTNPFFSQLKKRILMMTRNPSKRRALAKYALAVPIFLILTLLLASPKTKVMASTEAATEKVVASIETFEKDLTTPKSVDNNLVAPTDVLPSLNDTTIMGTPQMVFTLDGETPSSSSVMSLEKVRNLDKFSMAASVKTDKGKLERVKMIGLTVVRIAYKSGETTKASNTSMVFTEEMKDLVKMAGKGDTYQFIGHGTVEGEPKVTNHAFTYYIGDRPTQPRLEMLNPQQQAELANISESPVVLLAGKRVGVIDPKFMAKQDHLDAYQVINGQTIPVEIVSFTLFRVPNEGDPYQANNPTGKFSSETRRIVEMASINDRFQFMDVKCRVKGENMPVNVESLDFVIKGTPPQYIAKKDYVADPIYTIPAENPEFIGGPDSMFRMLGRTIKYPVEAREAKVHGTVYIGFIVEKDGSLTNIELKRNVKPTSIDTIQSFKADGTKAGIKIVTNQDQSCAEEAIRVISLMPKWKPGRNKKGESVRVRFTLPIKFKLE